MQIKWPIRLSISVLLVALLVAVVIHLTDLTFAFCHSTLQSLQFVQSTMQTIHNTVIYIATGKLLSMICHVSQILLIQVEILPGRYHFFEKKRRFSQFKSTVLVIFLRSSLTYQQIVTNSTEVVTFVYFCLLRRFSNKKNVQ